MRRYLSIASLVALFALVSHSSTAQDYRWSGEDPLGRTLYEALGHSMVERDPSPAAANLMRALGGLSVSVSVSTYDPDAGAGARTVASIAFRVHSEVYVPVSRDDTALVVREQPEEYLPLDWRDSHFARICSSDEMEGCVADILNGIAQRVTGYLAR
jgi:hypothetical protein